MKQYTGKKRLIQSYFYNKIINTSSFVGLAGNNLDLHILDIRKVLGNKKSNKAFIYELDTNIVNRFSNLQSDRIEILNQDILLCNITRFIDLDLMKTLSSIEGICYYLFNKQFNTFKNQYSSRHIVNTFMFTYSLRNCKRDLESFINSLIDNKDLINIISIENKRYRDACPMCTVQIMYNYKN